MADLGDIGRMFIGGLEIGAAYLGGEQIWPKAITYVIVTNSIAVHYTNNQNWILANASNQAYVTATVQAWRGSIKISEQTEELRVTAINSGNFAITNDGRVRGKDLDNNNNGMGAVSFPNGQTFNITAYGAHGISITNNPLTVVQQPNIPTATGVEYGIRFNFNLNNIQLPSTGGTSNYTATEDYYKQMRWTSGTVAYDSQQYSRNVVPTITSNPSTGVVVDTTAKTITFPENTDTTQAKQYTITAAYGSYQSQQMTVTVARSEIVITQITINSYEYPAYASTGQGEYNIPASGNTGSPIYPNIAVTIGYTRGSLTSNLSGFISGGATSGTARDLANNVSFPFNVVYLNSGGNNGGVTAASKGTTPSGRTTVTSILRVRVDCGTESKTSGYATVYQQENVQTYIAPRTEVSSFGITASATGMSNYTIPAKSVTVTLAALISGTDYSSGYSYTSEDPTDLPTATAFTNRDVTSDTTFKVDNVTSSSSFTASNQHNTTDKTYSVRGDYGTFNDTKTITQSRDSQSTVVFQVDCAITNKTDIWAGGGYSIVAATYRTHLVWDSDGEVISGSESSDAVPLENISVTVNQKVGSAADSSVYWLDSSRYLNHRDMKNNASTTTKDKATVTATVSGQSASDTVEVQNVLGSQEYVSTGNYNDSYSTQSTYDIKTFTIADYTSLADAASFQGASTTYTVEPRTTVQQIKTTTWDIYTDRRYSSWSDAHDDDEHRERTTTQGSSSEVVGTPQEYITGDFNITTPSWASATKNPNEITFNSQSILGTPRSGQVRVTNAAGGTSKSLTIYQNGYANLTVSPSSLNFSAQNPASKTFTVTWKYCTWNVAQDVGSFISSVSPDNGGSMSSTGTTTVSVAVPSNTQQVSRLTTLHVQSPVDGVTAKNVTISQSAAT